MASIKMKKTSQPALIPSWPLNWSEMERSFGNFRRDFERSFTSFPAITMPPMPKISSTSCDIIDEGDRLQVKVDMPGVKKNEIELDITDNSIEISAAHKEEKEEKKKNFLRKERSEVSYYRTLPLPAEVVSSKAKAKLTDGILSIVIPKSHPSPKLKKRSIKVQ